MDKTLVKVLLYAICTKVIACLTLMLWVSGSILAFMLFFMVFMWLCLENYANERCKSTHIVITALLGMLLPTMLIRIFDFPGTIGSLYIEPLGCVGICAGWLLAFKRKVPLLLLVLLVFVLITYVLGLYLPAK